MEELKKIHNWILDKRLINRISFKKMGAVIGYSDVGFKKALENKTLSITQLKTIISHFNFIDEYSVKFEKDSYQDYQFDPNILKSDNNPNYKPLTEKEASFIEDKFDNNFEELFKREKFKKEFIFRATEWLENFRRNRE